MKQITDPSKTLTVGNVYGYKLSKPPYNVPLDTMQVAVVAQENEDSADALNRHMDEHELKFGSYNAVSEIVDFGPATEFSKTNECCGEDVAEDSETVSLREAAELVESIEAMSGMYTAIRTSGGLTDEYLKEKFGFEDSDFNKPVGTRMVHPETKTAMEKIAEGTWEDNKTGLKIKVADEIISRAMRTVI